MAAADALANEGAADTPASSAHSSRGGLDEIVVTAQFRQNNLQNEPLAITAMSADMMQARSYTSVTEIGQSAPSVTLRLGSAGYGKSTQAYIRGIGQSDYKFALEPAVGFYVDDVYHASLFGSTFDLLDLERVEILRGPQGTLFGKNSIGGAVRLISKKPSNAFEASVEGTYGSYDRIDLRGMINVPIVDDILALRVSGSSKNRSGYVDRIDFVCANPALAGNLPQRTGEPGCKIGTLGGEEVHAGRAALRFTPVSNLEINLTAEILRDNSEAAADSLIYINESAPALVTFNTNTLIPNFGIPFDSRFITSPYVSYGDLTSSFLGKIIPSANTVHSDSYSGDIQWDITDNLQLRSITAWQRHTGRFAQEADNSPLPVTLLDTPVSFRQFTQEVRLLGSVGTFLDWAVGGFYFKSNSRMGGSVTLSASGTAFDQNDTVRARNTSFFAHGVFHLTDRLNVTLGLRHSDEYKTYRFDRTNQPAGTPFFPGGPFTSPKTEYDRFDYKAAIDYKITDDIMAYAQYSTGFKGGGINPRPFTPATAVPFGPETLKAYEIGLKTELFDRLARFNVAAYRSDYTNLQLSARSVDNDGAPSIVISNAGKAVVQGIEAELQIRAVEGLLIDASGSYTDFKITDLGAAAGVAGGPTLASKSPGTPDWKFSAGVQYNFDLGDAGSLAPRLDLNYQSKVYNEYTNDERAAQKGYALVNGRLTYMTSDEDLSLSVGVTNIFNKFYYYNKFIQAGSYIYTGQPGRPREWYVTVKKSF